MKLSQVATTLITPSLSAAFLAACTTPIKPDDLQVPQELSCVYLKEPLEITALYGPMEVQWTTRLERGPYWSERMDSKGIYYRAPAGGVSVMGKDGKGFPGQPLTLDGGFYVPNNSSELVSLYAYFSTTPAPANTTPGDSDCSGIAYTKDPSTSKVNLVSFSAAGAVGGAVGGLIARATTNHTQMTYGRAAGTGAVGGLIGGAIIGSIINADVGKIVPVIPTVKDEEFLGKLRALAATKAAIPEIQVPATESHALPSSTQNEVAK